jgi:hypothetical protein
MPIFQSNCAVGGTGNMAQCHADPGVAQPMGGAAGGGSRQYFGPPAPASYTSSLAMIYAGLVGAPSTEDLTMNVITAGDPTKSFLWYKITGTQGTLDATNSCSRGDLASCGSAMPLPLTGVNVVLLPQTEQDKICNWIVQGAKNN